MAEYISPFHEYSDECLCRVCSSRFALKQSGGDMMALSCARKFITSDFNNSDNSAFNNSDNSDYNDSTSDEYDGDDDMPELVQQVVFMENVD